MTIAHKSGSALSKAFNRSIKSATHLIDADDAAIRLGRSLALELDTIDPSDPELTSKERGDMIGRKAYLSRAYLDALKQLHLTPETRPAAAAGTNDLLEGLRVIAGTGT